MRYAVIRWALLFSCWVSLVTAADKPSPEQIRAWRAEGPGAVDRLMVEREKLVAAAKAVPGNETYSFDARFVEENVAQRAAWERVYAINETIDAVAAARYSHESGLYWYTDEAEANRVAKAQGKPILALRLLGNLNEELSCANSRYFRILLYPDDKVRQLLHDKFILTWKSVRPVPKITIDLGDGRKVERTITGNSVHYVVLPSGEVVDVFPGLYGPVPFCERLVKAHAVAVAAMRSHDSEVPLMEYRKQQIAALEKAWQADVAKYEELMRQPRKKWEYTEHVGLAPQPLPGFWGVAGEFHPEYAELSKATLDLIKHEAVLGYYEKISPEGPRIATQHGVRVRSIQAFLKGGDEAIMGMLLNCVEPALCSDTLQNEYCGRYVALQWLKDTPQEPLVELNKNVYRYIFAYEPHDPWIGLAQLGSLTALPKDRGLIREARAKE